MWLILFCHDNHIMALCLLASSFVNELPMANSYYDSLHYEKFPDDTVKCIENEIPFELPDGWEWARIASISSIVTDGEHKTPLRCNSFMGYYLLSARNIQNGYIILNDVDYVDEFEYNRISKRCNPKKNDVLISCSGSIGRIAVVSDDNKYVMVRSAAMVRALDLNPYYIMYVLQSEILQKQMNQLSKQTAQANLFQGAILTLLLPIPSLSEQERIVSKLNEIFTFINTIESDKSDFQTTIQLTKSKILDLAIRGKLVQQNPDDEHASVLLDRIRAEKEELIKQGKIKRDKKESVIFKGDDNSYYEDIPESWEVASISQLNFYQSSSVNPLLFPDEYFELFSVPNYDIGVPEIVKGTEIGSTKQSVESKDVLLCKINPRINRVWTVNCVTEYKTIASSEWIVFRNPILYPPYINIYLSSPLFRELLLTNVSGVGGSLMRAQPDSVKKYPVVIPPYNEQKRIADKVSQLFSLLDFIAENVN